MKFGLFVPNVGPFGDPGVLVEVARRLDGTGWDGFFVWDMLTPALAPEGPPNVVDPWVVLAAVAALTTRIRLGPMITPVARRSPFKLARETVSLDHLSGGRLIFGAGLGDAPEAEFEAFGEDGDPRRRAEKLDEGLDVLRQLWSGEETTFVGHHFEVERAVFLPKPVQEPRVPVWVGGHWPNTGPVRRAARWDGMFPLGDKTLKPDDYRQLRTRLAKHRTNTTDWDLVHGVWPGDRRLDEPIDAGLVAEYEASGVTWWFEMVWPGQGTEAALELAARNPLE